MKSNDLISIVIPVYNNYDYFEKCILSVINQTYGNLEIIIINDDSKDHVEDIILKYLDLDKRIIYLKNEKNLGVGPTRNKGISVARGQYIYFLDSDDYIEENCIEELYKVIGGDDSFSCITSFYQEINGKREEISRTKEQLYLLKTPSVCVRLFSKKILDSSGIRFSNIKIGEDLEFVFKVMLYNYKISFVEDNPLYTYVIHQDSSINVYSSAQLDLLRVMDNTKSYAKRLGIYEKFYNIIEYVSVDHILAATTKRISNFGNYNKMDIDKCIEYIYKNYPNWQGNNYVKEILLKNGSFVNRLKALGLKVDKVEKVKKRV